MLQIVINLLVKLCTAQSVIVQSINLLICSSSLFIFIIATEEFRDNAAYLSADTLLPYSTTQHYSRYDDAVPNNDSVNPMHSSSTTHSALPVPNQENSTYDSLESKQQPQNSEIMKEEVLYDQIPLKK